MNDKSIFSDRDSKYTYIARLRKIYDIVDVNFCSFAESDFYCLVAKKIKGALKYGIILGGTNDVFVCPLQYDTIKRGICIDDRGLIMDVENYQKSCEMKSLKFSFKDANGKKVNKTVAEKDIYEKAKEIKQERQK